MTWKDRLQDASFRGVPFKVEKKVREPVAVWKHMNTRTATTLYRRSGKSHFPPVHHSLCGGDDCFDQRDRLIEALNKPGPARLSTRHMVS